jgi:hypothetical protein
MLRLRGGIRPTAVSQLHGLHDAAGGRSTCDLDFNAGKFPAPLIHSALKAQGEAGAIGAPPAIVNAVVNALADRGISHVDMPLTPNRVWRLANA